MGGPSRWRGSRWRTRSRWALIRLDGADTAMLHAVDAGSAAAMATGMRVRARWAASPAGHIRDIACFEPCNDAGPGGLAETAQPEDRASRRRGSRRARSR